MKRNAIGIAILSTTTQRDGWYQLLPAGRFRARDGRPNDVGAGWLMTAEIAAHLIEGVSALGQDILIDYEHNQLRKHEGLAPEALAAAGWFNADEMEWRENEGLFIKPRWTPTAQRRIDANEFGFLSAVFTYDSNGSPLMLRMAALTNDPGVTGMQKLTALAANLPEFDATQQETLPMNEKLRQLLARLGITVPENADITDEQACVALSALEELQTKAQQVATLSAELENTKTASAAVDLTKFVPIESYNALRQQLAETSAQCATASLSAVLDKAEQEGRIFKSERSYFEQLGGQVGVAALSAQIETRQPIVALSAMQTTATGNKPDARRQTEITLSADEKAAAKALGMSEAEFMKLKQEQNA